MAAGEDLMRLHFHKQWLVLLDRVAECNTEKSLEDQVILPLLKLLGYEQGDFVQQAPLGRKRVDFLVKAQQRSPCPHYLVIEVKAPSQTLLYKSWQLRQYLRDSGSIFGLLTNGKQFQIFYNDGDTIHALWEFTQAQLRQDYRVLTALLLRRNCDLVLNAFKTAITKFTTACGNSWLNFHLRPRFYHCRKVSIRHP